MRSRTIREGSVGLLILVGLGLFGLLALWIRGLNPGSRSYQAIVEFPNVVGMQAGAPVRYRGVVVGKILSIQPGPNAVAVTIEITSANLLIPSDVLIEANQSGLIGETSVDMTPLEEPSAAVIATNPLDADCDNTVIICDGDRLQGNVGVSFEALIRSTVELTDLITDPVFFGEIRTLTRNTSEAAAGVAGLTRQVSGLTRSVERDLNRLTTSAATSATSVGQAANQIGLTAAQVNALLADNRSILVSTLGNLNQASSQLQLTVSRLAPAIEEGELLQNLEILSANAAEASANLRDLTGAVGDSDNILLLQQTLDSARATFQNTQKITADLDELTGDPEFRQNIRDLVDGLSGLVSSTQQLHQQTAVAQVLEPAAIAAESEDLAPSDRLAVTMPESVRLTLLNSQQTRMRPYTVTNSASTGVTPEDSTSTPVE
jgi:phospholipid/cholesterol/gamma-HCH transport system substrate-binding protein